MKKEVLIQLLANIDNYHNHKERMAWTSISIYLAFSIISFSWLMLTKFEGTPLEKSAGLPGIKVVLLLVFILIFFSTFCFTFMQFTMRWIVSCRSLILRRYLFNVDDNYALYDYTNNLDPTTNNADSYFPKRIENKINVLIRERNIKTFMIAFLSILFIFGIFLKCVNGRYKSEIPSYLTMILFFVPTLIIYCDRVL